MGKKNYLPLVIFAPWGFIQAQEACHIARKRKQGPDYIKLGRKILYSRESVIQFFNRQLTNDNITSANPLLPKANNE